MVYPSWLQSVPRKFGDKSSGTLKADEWRTMATVYLPILSACGARVLFTGRVLMPLPVCVP